MLQQDCQWKAGLHLEQLISLHLGAPKGPKSPCRGYKERRDPLLIMGRWWSSPSIQGHPLDQRRKEQPYWCDLSKAGTTEETEHDQRLVSSMLELGEILFPFYQLEIYSWNKIIFEAKKLLEARGRELYFLLQREVVIHYLKTETKKEKC